MTAPAPAELPWLAPGAPFPPIELAWGPASPAPGLLAAGGALDVASLVSAYRQGIFPWFSSGEPILWWSPEPRMVLQTARFRLHRSLRKELKALLLQGRCEVRFDTAFESVIRACASSSRRGQRGTWILPAMVSAYTTLHRAGYAHSVECWIDGELAGGLYCVALGRAVFGESMFTRRSNASKIALAALVGFCRQHGIVQIDCQQNTQHLASLGAAEMPRAHFVQVLRLEQARPAPHWLFQPLYWDPLLDQPDEPA